MQARRPSTGEVLARAEELWEPPDQFRRVDGVDVVGEDMEGSTEVGGSTPITEEEVVGFERTEERNGASSW